MRNKLNRNKSSKTDMVAKLSNIIKEEVKINNIPREQVSNIVYNFILNDQPVSSENDFIEEEQEQELQLNETLTNCSSSSDNDRFAYIRQSSYSDIPFKVNKIMKSGDSAPGHLSNNFNTNSDLSDHSHEDIYGAMKVYLKSKFNISNFKSINNLPCSYEDNSRSCQDSMISKVSNDFKIVDGFFNYQNIFSNNKQEGITSFAPSKIYIYFRIN